MIIRSADFVVSSADHRNCPEPVFPEFAFIGRSNVGKSSLINLLCTRKGLAKTSASPGKTRLINHFLINSSWYLVDLPGYGYARTSKASRQQWEKMIRAYFLNRSNLMLTFVLIDIRLTPQANDLEIINWFGARGIPMALIFTKKDKINQATAAANIKAFEMEMSRFWEKLPPVFQASSRTGFGREAILDYIESITPLFVRS